ncbi:uncharacterized protein (DUF58 family) [Leucobacter komagatae]|uniref:Uncharacterized protein (DUF58 family) n=1 Tax=Leucobacter komagatae TaxID=55969 RepID=A0A542Y7I5_9MICO|nr:DUF58 domain-containing protein [Leucobacter komagatae]TQL44005.1 uncharacterized protein (DUF58 family) [Leucobacter komagatae]
MSVDTSRAPDRGGWSRTQTHGTTRYGETATRAQGPGAELRATRRSRLRRSWRRTRQRLRRVLARATNTVTPVGWLALGAALIGAALGALFGWVEAWFVAILFGLLLLVALPFLLGNRAYLVRIALDRMRVVAGSAFEVRLEIENASRRPALPSTAELPVGNALREVPIPFVAGNGSVEVPLAVPAPARGVIEVGPLTLARQDPLGLLRREVTWRDRHVVRVHPRTVPLPPGSAGMVRDLEGAASSRLTDADLSFHAVREYLPGDPLRHVHWKSTAKSGTLMVRQYEESQTARAAVLFDSDLDSYAGEDEFELGVSVAASVSLQAVREGRERFIAAGADFAVARGRAGTRGLRELPSHTPEQLLDAWAELLSPEEPAPIEWLARSLAESRRSLSVVTIVTGSVPDIARLRRATLALPSGVAVAIVRCEELAEPTVRLADSAVFYTAGALTDLPQLQLRGSKL